MSAMSTGQLFSRTTQALFYNYKQSPVQRMLDFDFLCGKNIFCRAACISLKSQVANVPLQLSPSIAKHFLCFPSSFLLAKNSPSVRKLKKTKQCQSSHFNVVGGNVMPHFLKKVFKENVSLELQSAINAFHDTAITCLPSFLSKLPPCISSVLSFTMLDV